MQTKVNSVAIRATNATGAGKTSTLKIGDKIIVIYLYESGKNSEIGENIIINGVDNPQLDEILGKDVAQTSINLIVRTSTPLATSITISAESTAVKVR
jgi:hypothetical protein